MNIGCIASKFLLPLAEEYFYKNHGQTGLHVKSSFHLQEIIAEKEVLIERLKHKKTDRIVTGLGIEIITGTAEFIAPGHCVSAFEILLQTVSSSLPDSLLQSRPSPV